MHQLFTNICTLCIVYKFKCLNDRCGLIVHFDGSEFAILNMGIFVSYGVLQSYVHHFHHSGLVMILLHG